MGRSLPLVGVAEITRRWNGRQIYCRAVEIRALTQETITEAEADELARLKTRIDPRLLRTDPVVTRQLAINELRPSVSTYLFDYYGLFDGDRLLGYGETYGTVNAENTDIAEVGIWIDDQQLDRGLHRQLFDHILGIERDRGRTRVWGWGVLDEAATRGFWEGDLGYEIAYDERISRCVVADVDAQLMQHWIDRAAERASDYSLIRAQSPLDEPQLQYLAQALEAMNDAPVDDLVYEHETFDLDRAREIETLHVSTRADYRAIFAVKTSTGELAGFTAVRIPDAEPALSKQGDTVTIDAHRNQGIGRWLKASMWQWLRSERPEVEYIDTGNAESNRAMLAINEAMGFRDVLHHGIWHDPGASTPEN